MGVERMTKPAQLVNTWFAYASDDSQVYALDRDTGFEPAPSAWKAEMLAANTNPGFSEIYLSSLYKYYIRFFKKNQILKVAPM